MEFKDPLFLLLLLFLPLILISKEGIPLCSCLFPKFFKKENYPVFSFATLLDFNKLPESAIIKERFVMINLFRFIAFLFLILALARPQTAKTLIENEVSGRDIILSLDVSGSMLALDFELNGKKVNRLKALKQVVNDFIEQRTGDRIGIVIFGEDVYTQCPLTLDHSVVKDFVNSLEVGMLGDGTSLGDGIALSVKKLRSIKENSKVIILVTDGVKTSGSIEPIEAAEIAKRENIKIYTVGIGSGKPAPFAVPGVFGGTQIQYQNVELDEKSLRKIAETSSGKFFNAQNTEQLKDIYQEISKLEERTAVVKNFQEYQENFFIFLLIGIIFFVINEILEKLRYQTIP